MRLMEYHRRCWIVFSASVFLSCQWKIAAEEDVTDDVPIFLGCEAATCTECLNLGCGWFPLGGENGTGECVDTCSVIADAPCYSEEFFPGESPQMICDRVTNEAADAKTCAAIQGNCTLCVGTLLSDGTSTCVWYDISSTCGSGMCNLLGCGTTVCLPEEDPSVISSSSAPSMSPTALSDVGGGTSICERSSVSCDICLRSACAWAGGGLCLESCSMIADTSCYDNTTFANVTDVTEICARAEFDESDAALCLGQTSCTDCISVNLSIADRTCIWYHVEEDPSASTCCLACDVSGTLTTTCNDTAPVVNGECNLTATTCAECLFMTSIVNETTVTEATSCAWVSGVCLESCDDVMTGVKCYSQQSFPDINATEICLLEQQDSMNLAVCNRALDCMNCTMTMQSDNVTNCLWYAGNETFFESYCGPAVANNSNSSRGNSSNCDVSGVCGISECNGTSNNGGKEEMDENNTNSREPLNVTSNSVVAVAYAFVTMLAVTSLSLLSTHIVF